MIRTQIQLNEEQVRTIKKIAATWGVSSAEVIRRAVDALMNSPMGSDLKQRRSRALRAAGKFRSGKHDVSKRHDDYLAEAFSK